MHEDAAWKLNLIKTNARCEILKCEMRDKKCKMGDIEMRDARMPDTRMSRLSFRKYLTESLLAKLILNMSMEIII